MGEILVHFNILTLLNIMKLPHTFCNHKSMFPIDCGIHSINNLFRGSHRRIWLHYGISMEILDKDFQLCYAFFLLSNERIIE